MPESTQHKLDRVRRPRVQITYDVEIGGAIEKKELPFVVGILSDLSGNAGRPLPKMKSRKFVSIDRDTFGEIMKSIGPKITFTVDNTIKNDKTQFKVDLEFKELDDFNPLNVINQVEPLKKLLESRRRLSDLLAKLDGNDELEHTLQEVISSTEKLNEIKSASAAKPAEVKEEKNPPKKP